MEHVGGEGGDAADAAALPPQVQAPPSIEREERKEEDDGTVDEEMGVAVESSSERRGESNEQREEVEDEDDEDEEVLVVLELCDFKNHPVFDDYESLTLEGIDSASPMLRIGEFALHGQLEETVGTSFFYDTTQREPGGEYRYAGQTVRKIKFTIEPPEPSPLPFH